MKEMVRMVIVLTLFATVSACILAWANNVTSEPIANVKRAEKIEALKRVLPEFDNDPLQETREFESLSGRVVVHVARKEGEFVGAALVSSAKGYGGPVNIVMGVNADGTIQAVAVLDAPGETPGLGAKIKEAAFLKQFSGKPADATGWARVKKDGGEVDAITGATISSRAVSEAVRKGLEIFAEHAKELVERKETTDSTGEQK